MELALRQSGSAAALRATKKASAQGAKEGSYIGDVQVGSGVLHAAHTSLQQPCISLNDAARSANDRGLCHALQPPCLGWTAETYCIATGRPGPRMLALLRNAHKCLVLPEAIMVPLA